MRKIFATQVEIGMSLPCDIYNEQGVLLWTQGSQIKTEQQVNKLVREGYRSDLQEWIPHKTGSKASDDSSEKPETLVEIEKTFVYETVLDAILEIQLPLNYIFSVFNSDSFFKEKRLLTEQIDAIIDVILDICDKHPEEAIATVHMNRQGKHSILNAIDKAIVAALCGKAIDLPIEEIRSITSAALTANACVIKLIETISKQTKITPLQQEELNEAPANSLLLLTRCGVRDELWLDAVYMQKEKLNGAGVPRGLEGDDISTGGRILAIAEKYVSYILPNHTLRPTFDPATALKRLFKKNRVIMDGNIMLAFVKQCGVIPPGSFVNLKDNGVGVVIKQNEDGSKPIVTKVGNDFSKLFTEFNLTTTLAIESIVRQPNDIHKRLFKLWAIHESNHPEAE